MPAPVRILHLHSTFDLGGKEARAVRLMNAFGDAAVHTILTAVPGATGACAAIAPGIRVSLPDDAPSLVGKPGLGRYRTLVRYMRGFDLVLSYNWGAMDGVGARRLFGGPPLVHHEDGFNQDEADGQKPARRWFRRATLAAAARLVVPSHTLERIALTSWGQPASRVTRISNGVPLARYAALPEPGALPGFVRRTGEVVIGTIAGLRAVKNLGLLVGAMPSLPPHVRLVIVGEGPERALLQGQAAELGLGDRVLLTGFLDRPWRFVGHFDLLALSSLSEQMPIAVIEAMAAGLPVVSTDVGDVRAMLAPANARFVTPPGDRDAYVAALGALVADPAACARIGADNRVRAATEFNEDAMIARYATLYGEVLRLPYALAGF